MRLPRWQPWNTPLWTQMQQLQHEMNRLFDRWAGEGGRFLGITPVYPAVNVWEEGDNVFVEAELPGMDLKDLEIYVTGGDQLVLKGERKPQAPDKAVAHRQERGFGQFARTLALPFAVDADKVDARFEAGVLQVKLPKHASARPRKIVVKSE
jgi:HSP20 family protein